MATMSTGIGFCCGPVQSFLPETPSAVRRRNPHRPTSSCVSTSCSRRVQGFDFWLAGKSFDLKDRGGRRTRRCQQQQQQRRGLAFASIKDAQELLQSGVVRVVKPRDVGALLHGDGYKLLDVRPAWEWQKAHVAGAYHVPLFVEDVDEGLLTLIKKGIQAGQGGWWLGQKLTTRNEQFVQDVEATVPEGQKLVVACGEGLRSLLAVEELDSAGFEQMAWVDGGFNRATAADFPAVEGSTELRFATIGGASEYVLKFAIFLQELINRVTGRQKSVDGTR